MKTKVDISISRYQNTVGRDGVRIEVIDGSSRVHFLCMDLTLEQFATAVTGMYVPDVEADYTRLELVGTRAENKSESIPVNEFPFTPSECTRLDYAISTYEFDGWKRRKGDESNSHNFRCDKKTGKKFVEVVFFRHVKPDGQPVEG